MLKKLHTIFMFTLLASLSGVAGARAADDPDCGATAAASASQGPPAAALVAVGVPMAIADYFLGVALHEGSHCASAELFGANCTKLSILPGRSESGSFRLGETHWEGDLAPGQKAVVLLAPKIMDLTLMGGYAALLETGSLPRNKWGQLALVIAATGAVVDYGKHFVLRQSDNDVERVYRIWGIDKGWSRVPGEIFYGATILGGAIEVGRGWVKLFKSEPPELPGKTGEKKVGSSQLTKYGTPTFGVGTVGWQGEF